MRDLVLRNTYFFITSSNSSSSRGTTSWWRNAQPMLRFTHFVYSMPAVSWYSCTSDLPKWAFHSGFEIRSECPGTWGWPCNQNEALKCKLLEGTSAMDNLMPRPSHLCSAGCTWVYWLITLIYCVQLCSWMWYNIYTVYNVHVHTSLKCTTAPRDYSEEQYQSDHTYRVYAITQTL